MSSSSPELFVADLDRFLIDTDQVIKILGRACIAEGLDQIELLRRTENAEKNGKSYNAWEYVAERNSQNLEDAVRARFIENARENPILYNDTEEFLLDLATYLIPVLILTMGETKWQTIKLEAAGLIDRPNLIIHNKAKGKIIDSWRTPQGIYIPPAESINISSLTVILGDDKAPSFEGLPVDCSGYLLRRTNERMTPSQQGELPHNVKTVNRLYEISEDLIFGY
jgi:hypothetical protein